MANMSAWVIMAVTLVSPDLHIPPGPWGTVINTPGFRRIKRMVGTTRSAWVSTIPAALADNLYARRKIMEWNRTECSDVLSENSLCELGRFTIIPGARRANSPAGIDTLGPEISIISIILYISVPRQVNTSSHLMTGSRTWRNHYNLHMESCMPPLLTSIDNL